MHQARLHPHSGVTTPQTVRVVLSTSEKFLNGHTRATSLLFGLRKQGFTVVAHDTSGMTAVKAELGIPDAMASCHTAMVGGYVIEGHVPAADIERAEQDFRFLLARLERR